MRSRAQSSAHAEAVARRLALLGAELNGERAAVGGAGAGGDPWAPPEEHTRVRPLELVKEPGPEPVTPVELVVPVVPVELPPEPAAAPAAGQPPAIPMPGRHAARRRSPWLDLSAFRGRVSLTSAHVAVLAVVAALALALTTWWVLRDDPGTAVAPVGTGASLVGLEAAEGSPGVVAPDGSVAGPTTTAGEVVVDVAGKVRRPGIVVLDPGARVVDAIEAAGGVLEGADLTGLNQARVLVDGEQIVVGIPPPPGHAAAAPAPTGGGGGLVNINTASSSELEELPGVGPVTAASIVSWREQNGGFRSVDQLLEVEGIGEKTLARLAPHVTL